MAFRLAWHHSDVSLDGCSNCSGRYGDAEALVFYDGDTRVSWSYARLWEEANAVARALIAAENQLAEGALIDQPNTAPGILAGVQALGGVEHVLVKAFREEEAELFCRWGHRNTHAYGYPRQLSGGR